MSPPSGALTYPLKSLLPSPLTNTLPCPLTNPLPSPLANPPSSPLTNPLLCPLPGPLTNPPSSPLTNPPWIRNHFKLRLEKWWRRTFFIHVFLARGQQKYRNFNDSFFFLRFVSAFLFFSFVINKYGNDMKTIIKGDSAMPDHLATTHLGITKHDRHFSRGNFINSRGLLILEVKIT